MAFFLFGFDKGDRANITDNDKKGLQKLAGQYFGYTPHAIRKAMNSGEIIEVT